MNYFSGYYMKRLFAFALALVALPVQAEFGLIKSTPQDTKPSELRAASPWVTVATSLDDAQRTCLIKTKNPLSGTDFSLPFGTTVDTFTECYTSLFAFNTAGQGVLLDSSVFDFSSDAYKHPERVNRVSFYDKNGTLEVTHNLPPLTSAFFGSGTSTYKQYNAQGIFAFPLQRQNQAPPAQRENFRNALDLDGAYPVTTEVVLATATKTGGIKILENRSICGNIGCTYMDVISVLDNGKIWLSLYRALESGETEDVTGWVNSTTGDFTPVTIPSVGNNFEGAGVASVNERGDLLAVSLPKAQFDIVSGREHTFLIDGTTGAVQDLSCQIEYGDSNSVGAIFESEDKIGIISVSQPNQNIGASDDSRTLHSFARGAALAPSRCVTVQIKLDPACKKRLQTNLRAKLQDNAKLARKTKTTSYVCSGSVRAIDKDGSTLKGAAYVLQTYGNKDKIKDDYIVVSSQEYRGYRWIESDQKGIAHFKVHVPSFAAADMFVLDIHGPLKEGVSAEQYNYSLDTKKTK